MKAIEEPIILKKPAGIPCFPYHKDPEQDCLLYQLWKEYPEQKNWSWPEGFEGGIAHRLDIPTSGQVLVARDPEHLQQIRLLFSEKRFEKEYFFLSAKPASWREHTVTASIAHDRKRSKRMVVKRGENTPKRGKWLPAQTHFCHVYRDSIIGR